MDVIITTFLNGLLNKEIYMSQSLGYEVPGQKKKVCSLLWTLYGLKQCPRIWNERFNIYLLNMGFIKCIVDPNVYQKQQGSNFVILGSYVNDSIVDSNKLFFSILFKFNFQKIMKWQTIVNYTIA